MANFLTTSGIAHHLENIIRQARQKLVLVSPYLQLSRNFTERLLESDRKGTQIILIYGKEQLNHREWDTLRSMDNLSCYFSDNLHAKDCYQGWSQFGNVDYPENYCHGCGRERAVSSGEPQCERGGPL